MKIAIYGRVTNPEKSEYLRSFFDCLAACPGTRIFYKPFYRYLCEQGINVGENVGFFNNETDLPDNCHCLISLGGDGSFLEAARLIQHRPVPILGINMGRLGFLSSVAVDEIQQALEWLQNGQYSVEKRVMLQVKGNVIPAADFFPHALNEISVQRSNPAMIYTCIQVDGQNLLTYWCDGLVIATPTGSTAYSLSVGGPIVVPGSGSFIISPIASHNLNARPIVIPDSSVIELEVQTRQGLFNLTADNQMVNCESGSKFTLSKSAYTTGFIKFNDDSFFKTIRNKLLWGNDLRG